MIRRRRWRVRKRKGKWMVFDRRGKLRHTAPTWRQAVTFALIGAEGERPTQPTIPFRQMPFSWRRELLP